MEINCKKLSILSGNSLKIIAAISMALDHIGFVLFPYIEIFRILGRISLPIFAFMIAEGCKYTKNKLKYFLTILILGSLFQVVYYIVDKSFYMGILITFSISILLIYSLMNLKKQFFRENRKVYKIIIAIALFLGGIIGCYYLNEKFIIDYDFYGCILAVFPSIFHHDTKGNYENKILRKLDNKYVNILMLTIGCILLAIHRNTTQYFSLLAIPLLLLYSNKRGKINMKYFFYIFYPVHLVIIYMLSYIK